MRKNENVTFLGVWKINLRGISLHPYQVELMQTY
nr:MAG TPA: hypothetical protein [Caudoviricetes sp.]